jgi:serine/threonine-protein kinase
MGTVYKVRHRGLETELALKVLARELGEDPDAHLRFQREARVVARLEHPNIVRVLDIDRDPQRDMAYIVMELIDGVTVEQRLRAAGALPLIEALEVAIQVGRALAHAHAHTPPIVHRDVKPANIMLEAGSGRAVVMDFGIAKEVGDGDVTRTGQTMGTVKYSPPEQIRGEPLTPKADVYALGMVLYELVTGRQVFAGMEKAAIVGRLLYEPDEIVPAFDPETPPALQALIQRAIAKSADARPEMTALVAGLERYRHDLTAPPPATPSSVPPATPDEPATVVRAAPERPRPTDGWDDAPDDDWVLGDPGSPRRDKPRPRRRSRVPLVTIAVLAVAAAALGAGLYVFRGDSWQRSLYLPPALLITATVSATPSSTPTATATPSRTPRPTATVTRSADPTAVATLMPAVAEPSAAPSVHPTPAPVPPTARPAATATPLPQPRLRARTPPHDRVTLLDTQTRVFAVQVEIPGAPAAALRYAWALDGRSAGSAAAFELKTPAPGHHEVSVIVTAPSGDRVLRRWMVEVDAADAPGRAAATVLARSLDDTVSPDRTTMLLAGTVENVDHQPAENLVVEVDAVDARDRTVLHRTAVPLPQPLAPGGTGTFELELPNLPEIERFRVRVLSH